MKDGEQSCGYLLVHNFRQFDVQKLMHCSKIIQDVGPTLLPDEELSDLAAAEGAVNEKVAERNAIVDRLGDELRRMSSLLLSFPLPAASHSYHQS